MFCHRDETSTTERETSFGVVGDLFFPREINNGVLPGVLSASRCVTYSVTAEVEVAGH